MISPTIFLIAALTAGDDPPRPAYLFPARDVGPALLESDGVVKVSETDLAWKFEPVEGPSTVHMIFFPGGGVEPTAYADLVRRVAAEGYAVHLVKSAPGFAFPAVRKPQGVEQASAIRSAEPEAESWVVGGHSLGAAIASSCVHENPADYAGLILIGTTHPRDFDLSGWDGIALKIVATADGVAPIAKVERNRKLLPASTRWATIEGGNHAQYGSYGPQPGDGAATISEARQRDIAASAIVETLRLVVEPGGES